jgi:hypothetical protein
MENGFLFGAAGGASQSRYASATSTRQQQPNPALGPVSGGGGLPLRAATTKGPYGGGGGGYVSSSSLPSASNFSAAREGAGKAHSRRPLLVIRPAAPPPPGPPLHSPRPSDDAPKASAAHPHRNSVAFPGGPSGAGALDPAGLGLPTPAHFMGAARTRGRVSSLERVPSSSLLGFSEEAPLSPDSLSAEQQAAAAAALSFGLVWKTLPLSVMCLFFCVSAFCAFSLGALNKTKKVFPLSSSRYAY